MSIIQGTSKAAGGGGYTIDQSIRFNIIDNAKLTRTFGTATNRKIYTLSVWGKIGSSSGSLLENNTTGGVTWANIKFGDDLRFFDYSGGSARIDLRSKALHRDPSSWYHVVVAVDTTQATSTNRIKMYVNGVQITSFSIATYPSLNFNGFINSAVSHVIGDAVNGAFDGYLAEYHFIDGTALDPTSFGETNDDGVWVPIAYTGSYGINGFYLTGEDSADLGEDFSGNGNDFTSSGLTTTDQMLDTPTDNFWTLTPLDSNSTLANGNLQNKGGNSKNTHAPAFPTTGKWYVEIDCNDIITTGYGHFFGICDASVNFHQTFADHAVINAGQERGGQLKKNNSNTTTGTAVNDGDIIALAFDADNLTLDLYVNNSQSGSQITGLTDVQYKLWIHDGASVTDMQVNFGQSAFTYTPPTGFVALSTANLPGPTIADGSAYFQTTLYTGTGSSQAVTQSGDSTFQPDLVWIKKRSGATEHVLTDAVRGVTKEFSTNDYGVEETVAQGLTSFDSAGFTVGTDGSYNTSSATYVGWQWKANGAGSTNTDGTISSTVSANTTAGFSIVAFTAPASGTVTVGHGLSSAPELIILKKITPVSNWWVFHQAIGATKYAALSLTAAFATHAQPWNNTSPSATVFTSTVSWLGAHHSSIAYCWHSVADFSKFGSYTGNGSTNGAFVYTGFRPSWVMTKRTNTTSAWTIFDNQREGYNVDNDELVANTTAAETTTDYLDIVSNGFKLRSTDADVNASGSTYIYMAIVESPFKTANAR